MILHENSINSEIKISEEKHKLLVKNRPFRIKIVTLKSKDFNFFENVYIDLTQTWVFKNTYFTLEYFRG